MKIWVLSDIHRSAGTGEWTPPAIPDADIVVVAGDVCEGLVDAVAWAAKYLRPHMPVVMVAGNREFHGGEWSRDVDPGRREAERLDVHFLEDETLYIQGIAISGCTLWTDYALAGPTTREAAMDAATAELRDHWRIETTRGRRLTPSDASKIHRGSLEFLEDAAGTAIVRVFVTHHAPSARSLAPVGADDLLDAAAASNLDRWIERSGPELWIHGHAHISSDYVVGKTRIVCNPRGRDPRNRNFDPGFVVELDVGHRAVGPVPPTTSPDATTDAATDGIVYEDLDSFLAGSTISAPAGSRRLFGASTDLLAKRLVESSISKADLRRIRRDAAVAVVAKVPGPDWVEPARLALEEVAAWSVVFARDGSSKSDHKPTKGNGRVATDLANGNRVLGVSQSPEAYLPSALMTVADICLDIAPPSEAAISKTIRDVTGSWPRKVPAGVAMGLDHAEICAAIRPGSARACVERLLAATASKAAFDPTVADAPPFEDLVGYGEVGAWGTRLVEDVRTIRTGNLSWSSASRYMVMCSEPGLGKTSFVRSLAKSTGLPLVVTSVANWFSTSSGYLDGVIKAADAAFAAAAASRSGAILFLDELDALPSRSSMSARAAEWWTPVVTYVLLKIELLPKVAPHVVVIGATNHADKLDPALIRPGRLHPVFVIDPPNTHALSRIVRQHLGDDLPDFDLSVVAELGLGATGADAAGWVRDARARARMFGRALAPDDLLAQVAPPERRSTEALRRTSAHESAHAAAVTLLRLGVVEQLSTVVRGDRGGFMGARSLVGGTPTRTELENVVVGMLVGRAAEVVVFGEASSGAGGGPDSDLARATELLVSIHGSYGLGGSLSYKGVPGDSLTIARDPRLAQAVEADLVRLNARAEEFVREHGTAIERLAARLLRDRVLSGDQVRALLRGEDADPIPAEPL